VAACKRNTCESRRWQRFSRRGGTAGAEAMPSATRRQSRRRRWLAGTKQAVACTSSERTT